MLSPNFIKFWLFWFRDPTSLTVFVSLFTDDTLYGAPPELHRRVEASSFSLLVWRCKHYICLGFIVQFFSVRLSIIFCFYFLFLFSTFWFIFFIFRLFSSLNFLEVFFHVFRVWCISARGFLNFCRNLFSLGYSTFWTNEFTMPRKAAVTVEEAVHSLKKFIFHLSSPKLPPYSSDVWKKISIDLNNKWTAHHVYNSVHQDRRGILTRARSEMGIAI